MKRLNELNNADTSAKIDIRKLKPLLEKNKTLVSSPYTTPNHLLDLQPLTIPQRLVAQALTTLQPLNGHYAAQPYHQAFNWSSVMANLRSLHYNLPASSHACWTTHTFYIVVFRSQLPPSTDRSKLGEMDERSHAEANKSGGLLKYWFGIPDSDGRNLATCVWRDFADARPASAGPGHREAAKKTIQMYTEWKIERLALKIEDDGFGGVGGWSIQDWQD